MTVRCLILAWDKIHTSFLGSNSSSFHFRLQSSPGSHHCACFLLTESKPLAHKIQKHQTQDKRAKGELRYTVAKQGHTKQGPHWKPVLKEFRNCQLGRTGRGNLKRDKENWQWAYEQILSWNTQRRAQGSSPQRCREDSHSRRQIVTLSSAHAHHSELGHHGRRSPGCLHWTKLRILMAKSRTIRNHVVC